ncbi:hypothetical protein ACLF6K_38855 (plasmid) [Streptomyces xanthophaeus]|uniref:hypothetical protein n=1 Tax=Streptomyces xanthophaeus TaxID=67385 RepID=UPI00398FFBF9
MKHLDTVGDVLADPEAGYAAGLSENVHPDHVEKSGWSYRPRHIAPEPVQVSIGIYASPL